MEGLGSILVERSSQEYPMKGLADRSLVSLFCLGSVTRLLAIFFLLLCFATIESIWPYYWNGRLDFMTGARIM